MMARLEEICAINMGQSPDSSTYNEDGNGLPFFQGNADFGEIYPAVRMWCSEPTKIAREKDILISVRAPIGALNIANCECCIGRGLAALTVNEDICAQEYLWHALSGKVDELNSKGTGSTFKAINKKTLSETEIPLPPIDEQRKIAAILDKVSDLIAKRQQQLDKLDEAVKARFVEIFGEPDENPKHWQEDELSHHLKVIGGYAFKSDGFTDEGIPVLRIGNINSGHFLPVNMVYWPDDLALARYKVFPGDLVMSLTGTVGKDDYGNVCILGADYDEYYLNQRNAKLSIEISLNKCYFSELLSKRTIITRAEQSYGRVPFAGLCRLFISVYVPGAGLPGARASAFPDPHGSGICPDRAAYSVPAIDTHKAQCRWPWPFPPANTQWHWIRRP